MCQHLARGRVTKMPPHTGTQLAWTEDAGLKTGMGMQTGFTYVAPVVKYSPAAAQPGPVYWTCDATKVGHQPWNFSQVWTAYSTPSQMDWAYSAGYKGTQSAASFALAQNAISQLLALRSINNSGGTS